MNADSFPFWIILNVMSIAMVALVWYAHCRFPQRVDRASALVRSSLWIVFAVLINLSLVLG